MVVQGVNYLHRVAFPMSFIHVYQNWFADFKDGVYQRQVAAERATSQFCERRNGSIVMEGLDKGVTVDHFQPIMMLNVEFKNLVKWQKC